MRFWTSARPWVNVYKLSAFLRRRCCATLLLLLVLDELNVIFWDVLVLFQQKLLNLGADVALYLNLFSSARKSSHRGPGRELLTEVLGHL